MAINAGWIIPKDVNNMADRIAAARAIEFQLGWFGDPIYKVRRRLCNTCIMSVWFVTCRSNLGLFTSNSFTVIISLIGRNMSAVVTIPESVSRCWIIKHIVLRQL